MPYGTPDSVWSQMPESIKNDVKRSQTISPSASGSPKYNPYLVGPGGMPTQAAIATIPQAALNKMLPVPVKDTPKLDPGPTLGGFSSATQSAYAADKWQKQIDAIKQSLAQAEGDYNWNAANLKTSTWNNAADYGNTRGSYNNYAMAQGMRPLDQGIQNARDQAAQDIDTVKQQKAAFDAQEAANAAAEWAREQAADKAAAAERLRIQQMGQVKPYETAAQNGFVKNQINPAGHSVALPY